MHDGVTDWTQQWISPCRTVIDVGGRDINGTAVQAFHSTPYEQWVIVDVRDSLIPDHCDLAFVADFADFDPPAEVGPVDFVLCTEVFEHAETWREICANAFRVLEWGGRFIVTTVTPAYGPHSAEDGNEIKPGEYYDGIIPEELEAVLEGVGFRNVQIQVGGPFLNAVGTK